MWTEWHFKMGKVCTVVTSRFSGGSYLNRVELLNGCVAVGHLNLFIRSTIIVSNRSTDGFDNEKLQANLDAAANVYINAVASTKCAGNPIVLVKGAENRVSKRYLEEIIYSLSFKVQQKSNQHLKRNSQKNILTSSRCGLFGIIT